MPKGISSQHVTVANQRSVTDAEIVRQRQLPGEVHAGQDLVSQPAAFLQSLVPRRSGSREQFRDTTRTARYIMDQCDGHVTGYQADPAVEADVIHRTRHGFQTDGGGALRAQPVDAGTDHDRPETLALA